jgi:hypothetical protein
MKFCEDCRTKRGWPKSIQRTFAYCEVCKKGKLCYEMDKKKLPPEPKGKLRDRTW